MRSTLARSDHDENSRRATSATDIRLSAMKMVRVIRSVIPGTMAAHDEAVMRDHRAAKGTNQGCDTVGTCCAYLGLLGFQSPAKEIPISPSDHNPLSAMLVACAAARVRNSDVTVELYRRTPTRLTPPFQLPGPAVAPRTAARATGRGLRTTPALATQPTG